MARLAEAAHSGSVTAPNGSYSMSISSSASSARYRSSAIDRRRPLRRHNAPSPGPAAGSASRNSSPCGRPGSPACSRLRDRPRSAPSINARRGLAWLRVDPHDQRMRLLDCGGTPRAAHGPACDRRNIRHCPSADRGSSVRRIGMPTWRGRTRSDGWAMSSLGIGIIHTRPAPCAGFAIEPSSWPQITVALRPFYVPDFCERLQKRIGIPGVSRRRVGIEILRADSRRPMQEETHRPCRD